MNDNLIFTKRKLVNYYEYIKKVFDKLWEHQVKLEISTKKKKSELMKTETKYLSVIVNGKGMKPDTDNVECLRIVRMLDRLEVSLPWCHTTCDLFQWLNEITELLINLIKKCVRFWWDKECERAFTEIKDTLTVVPLLFHPDVDKRYILYTDSSNKTLKAILVQEIFKPYYKKRQQ